MRWQNSEFLWLIVINNFIKYFMNFWGSLCSLYIMKWQIFPPHIEKFVNELSEEIIFIISSRFHWLFFSNCVRVYMLCVNQRLCEWISTSNHMFGRAIWDKLPKWIFEIFGIAQVKRGQFQNFNKSRQWFIPKITWTKHAVPG